MECFSGWRRKVGLLTLVMASAAMCFWLRSVFTFDAVNIPVGVDEYFQIGSTNEYLTVGRLSISRIGGSSRGRASLWMSESNTSKGETATWMKVASEGNSCGVGIYDAKPFGVMDCNPAMRTSSGGEYHAKIRSRLIPFWSVTIPLTLISAFLLLANPKTSTQKKIPEPITDE